MRGRRREQKSERSDLQSCPRRSREAFGKPTFTDSGLCPPRRGVDRNLCARCKVHPFRRLAPQVSSSPVHSVSARAPSTPPLLQSPALCPSQAGEHGSHRLSAPRHLAQTLTRYGGADESRVPWLEAPGRCPQRGSGHNGNALLGALRGFPPGEGRAVPTGADPRGRKGGRRHPGSAHSAGMPAGCSPPGHAG